MMAKKTQQLRETKTERCPLCKSAMTYYRRKTKDFACRSCGKTWSKP